MKTYHKIQTLFKRDMEKKKHPIIIGEYTLDEFEALKDTIWIATEKIDGTNIRVILDDNGITFGGKTDNANIPAKLFARLVELFTVEKLNGVFSDREPGSKIVLYGEGYGGKIQKGGNYSEYEDFILFDVNYNGIWLKLGSTLDIAGKLGVKHVPYIGGMTIDESVEFVRKGFESRIGKHGFLAEGLVIKPECGFLDRRGQRIVTKIKHKDFLALEER